jgi:hypothetical protein
MPDPSAEPTAIADSRRLVFTTTAADALALEDILKPANRGWRSLLGYAIALPPLVVISWLTRNSEWPVWFVSFGLAGVVAWQGAALLLKLERTRAAAAHPIGAGDLLWSNGRLTGRIGDVAIDVAAQNVRVESDGKRLHILSSGQPAVIVPLTAFSSAADMAAFAAAFDRAGRLS